MGCASQNAASRPGYDSMHLAAEHHMQVHQKINRWHWFHFEIGIASGYRDPYQSWLITF